MLDLKLQENAHCTPNNLIRSRKLLKLLTQTKTSVHKEAKRIHMRTLHWIKCLTRSKGTKELTRESLSRQSFTIYAVSVPGEEQKEKEEKEEKEEKPGRSTPQSTRNPRPRSSIRRRLSNKHFQELECSDLII